MSTGFSKGSTTTPTPTTSKPTPPMVPDSYIKHFFEKGNKGTAITAHTAAIYLARDNTIYTVSYSDSLGNPYTAVLMLSLLLEKMWGKDFKKLLRDPNVEFFVNYDTKIDRNLFGISLGGKSKLVALSQLNKNAVAAEGYKVVTLNPTTWTTADMKPFTIIPIPKSSPESIDLGETGSDDLATDSSATPTTPTPTPTTPTLPGKDANVKGTTTTTTVVKPTVVPVIKPTVVPVIKPTDRDIDLTKTSKAEGYHTVHRLYLAVAHVLALQHGEMNNLPAGKAIASILVARNGDIIGWGINTNEGQAAFHHAEVNMMLAYYLRTKQQIPEHSRFYTSLQCCMQCSAMLDRACGGKRSTLECYYGMHDKGSGGNATPDNVPITELGTNRMEPKPIRQFKNTAKVPNTSLSQSLLDDHYDLERSTNDTNRSNFYSDPRNKNKRFRETTLSAAEYLGDADSQDMVWSAKLKLKAAIAKYKKDSSASKSAESRVPAVLGKIEPFLNLLGINL